MKKIIIGLIIGTIVVISGATSAFAARAYINDLQKVCTWQYSGSTAILIGNTVYDWRCELTNGQQKSLSIYWYCVSKYGSNANTSFDSQYLPYSWYCTY